MRMLRIEYILWRTLSIGVCTSSRTPLSHPARMSYSQRCGTQKLVCEKVFAWFVLTRISACGVKFFEKFGKYANSGPCECALTVSAVSKRTQCQTCYSVQRCAVFAHRHKHWGACASDCGSDWQRDNCKKTAEWSQRIGIHIKCSFRMHCMLPSYVKHWKMHKVGTISKHLPKKFALHAVIGPDKYVNW